MKNLILTSALICIAGIVNEPQKALAGAAQPVFYNQKFDVRGVAVDKDGNVYASDRLSCRVYKIHNGTYEVYAGNGSAGYNGDSIPAKKAKFIFPSGLAFDQSGNLYVSGGTSQRVRKIDTKGIITTVAGNGTQGFPVAGIALNSPIDYVEQIAVGPNGDLYMAGYSSHSVEKVDANGLISNVAGIMGYSGYSQDDGAASQAAFVVATGVAVDAQGNVFVSDDHMQTVRKVSPDGKIVTVAGKNAPSGSFGGDNGPANKSLLSAPEGLAVDAQGNLYIADRDNNRIRKVSADGVISTIAGNGVAGFSGDEGPATAASINSPYAVAVDAAGNVYIADYKNGRVRMVDTAGIMHSVFAGQPPA